MFLRLRHVCIVARDLDAVRDDLMLVFGLSAGHSDPRISEFGLRNAVLPVGTSFIEIVAPLREGTTAGRYLDRRRGDGGYMAIFDTDDLPSWRRHVAACGVREAALLEFDGYEGVHLHPRDTGGPLLELNQTPGGEALDGAYFPAGPDWQAHVQTARVGGIAGLEIQSDHPWELAQRWSEILRCEPPAPIGDTWDIAVGDAFLRFRSPVDDRGEGLCGVFLSATDSAAIRATARERGLDQEGDTIFLAGLRWSLGTDDPAATQTAASA